MLPSPRTGQRAGEVHRKTLICLADPIQLLAEDPGFDFGIEFFAVFSMCHPGMTIRQTAATFAG